MIKKASQASRGFNGRDFGLFIRVRSAQDLAPKTNPWLTLGSLARWEFAVPSRALVLWVIALLFSSSISAQNLLGNPGFENSPPTKFGNNIGYQIVPWVIGTGNQPNVVQVDGSSAYNYNNSGPQFDADAATNTPGIQQHYLDVVGVNDFHQSFTVPVCGGASSGDLVQVSYSGWFSTRDNKGGDFGLAIRQGVGVAGTVLSQITQTLPAPPSSKVDPWVQLAGTVNVAAGSTISYVVSVTQNINFDQASMTFSTLVCPQAPLTLRKSWVTARVNDAATLTVSRSGAVIDTLASTANSVNETDTDPTPVTVLGGESLALAEVLGVANTGNYAGTLLCSGGGSLSGATLTVDSTSTAIVCTYTNQRLLSIDAVADIPAIVPSSGGNTPSVVANDLSDGAAAILTGPGANASLTPGTAPAPAAGSIIMNTDGTVTVANGTTPGTYPYSYTLCVSPATSPVTCDTATTTIVVGASIDSVNDVPVAVPSGGGITPSVTANDVSNGVPAVLSGPGTNASLTPGTAPAPVAGSILMNADGSVTVTSGTTPGTYPYSYTLCVSPATSPVTCDTATISVLVGNPVISATNDPAIAITAAGGRTPVLTANDTIDGTPVVIGVNAAPPVLIATGGITGLVINPDGSISVPANTPAGSYTATYQVCSLTAPSVCAQATVVINVDNQPVALPDSIATAANTPVKANLVANDTGLEDGPLTFKLLQPPAPETGSVVINADGTYDFTPAAGFSGPANFTYEVCDADGDCAKTTVTVIVAPADKIPVAVADKAETPINTPVVGNLALNDLEKGDGTAVFSLVSAPANGLFTLATDGNFTYTPAIGFTGTVTFTYKICDTDGDCAVAPVAITVAPEDDQPVAADDLVETPINTPVSGNLAANDTGTTDRPTVYTLSAAPTSGTVVVNSDGSFIYTPATGFTGTATFSDQVCDADGDCDTANVSVLVTPEDDVPVAVDDSLSTPVDTPVTANLAVNDTNLTDKPLSFAIITPPNSGDVVLNQLGVASYTPNPGSLGADAFSYRICDADGDCDTANVAITVTPALPPNMVPVATNDSFELPEGGGEISRDLTSNDVSGNGASSYRIVAGSETTQGTVTVASSGIFTYTPDAGFVGQDSFQYQVCDADGDCAIARVVLTVTPSPSKVLIQKLVSSKEARPGAFLAYTLIVQNLTSAPVTVDVVDTPPNGLAFVPGSAQIKDLDNAMSVTGTQSVQFGGVDIQANGTATIRYLLRVGAALPPGSYTNQALAQQSGFTVSNIASVVVIAPTEGSDPVFEQSRLWGKVFNDQNSDGWQDADEAGIPGVRLATVEGMLLETDSRGRYNLEGLSLSNQVRGQNVIVKLDTATLPAGATITTENPLLRRITPGLPARFDFGVKLASAPSSRSGSVDLAFGEVLFESGSVVIRPQYASVIERMVQAVLAHQHSEIALTAEKAPGLLAMARAEAMRDAVLKKVGPEKASSISFRIDATTGEMVVSVDGNYKMGQVLFDTDKWVIKSEYRDLMVAVAKRIATALRPVTITLTGYADVRSSAEHNKALSLKRARAVAEAISAHLTPEQRTRVRILDEATATEVQP